MAAGRNKPLKPGRVSAVSQAQRLVLGDHRPRDPLISKAPSGGLVQAAMLAARSRPGPPFSGKIASAHLHQERHKRAPTPSAGDA